MASNLTRTARWLNMQSKAHALPSMLFLTDDVRTPDPVVSITNLPRDTGVIFRHYNHPDRELLAASCAEVCRKQRRFFSVAGDGRLALCVGAQGVHLPERLLHLAPRIKDFAPRLFITAAVHSKRALLYAHQCGAHAALASPVFPTTSHPDARTLGPVHLARWSQDTSLPLYALGGIDQSSAQRIKGTGVVGIAAIGALMNEKT